MPSGGDWKALYDAARLGDVDGVRHWLAAGVDPNLQHLEFGTTPLITAAERGHEAVVKLLVEKGADPKIRSDWDGWTAEEAAEAAGHDEIADWLSGKK